MQVIIIHEPRRVLILSETSTLFVDTIDLYIEVRETNLQWLKLEIGSLHNVNHKDTKMTNVPCFCGYASEGSEFFERKGKISNQCESLN